MSVNKKLLITLFKFCFTFIALYWVFYKVDMRFVLGMIVQANSFYVLLALLFFNLSKIVSSVRLNLYFEHISLKISELYALRLYYIGMFYNLFLPGGIGGDGYKVYLLHKKSKIKVTTLLQATFLDRLSGLIPLLFFAGVLFVLSDFYGINLYLDGLIIAGILMVFPLFYLFNYFLFKRYIAIFFKTTLLGSVVQILQLFSALFIIYAIDEQHSIVFLTLFLLSSVMAVLPISIGGVGIRELSFMYGLTLLHLDASSGVAFSLLFFLVTVVSSLVGIFLNGHEEH